MVKAGGIIDIKASVRDCICRGLLMEYRTFRLWVTGSNVPHVDSDQSLLQFKLSVPYIN